jgi:O-antigen ligase
MTAILRRDNVLLAALLLLQAMLLVWLTGMMSAPQAALVVTGAAAAAVLAPLVIGQAWARIRTLASHLSWWHGLWALLFCSDFVFRVRDVQSIQDNPLDAWALYRVGLVGLVGFVLLWRLLTHRGEWLQSLFTGLLLVMAAFPLAGLISTGWSVYPSWTLYKSVELLIDISVCAAAVAAAGSPDGLKSLFDWTWFLFALIQCTVWVGALVAPARALQPATGMLHVQLAGVMPDLSSNGVGHIAALLAVVALSRLLRREGTLLYGLLFASSVATMLLSQTRSALLGFAVGALLVLLLSGRVLIVFSAAVAAVIVLLATSAGPTFIEYFRRGQNAEMFDSLSGRMDWWSFAWQRFMERPFTGFGAFAGGRFAALAEMGDQTTSSVHNTYLEAILGLGVMGVLPVLICLGGTWWRLLKSFASHTSLEAIGVLAVLTVRSVFTTDLIWHPALPWLLVLALAELLRREGRAEA